MKLSSIAFDNNEFMPKQYTCDGQNVNPHLIIEEIPENAVTLALIMDDPDAPMGTWTHWLVWNIPAETTDIYESLLPDGAIEGLNSGRNRGYDGPCPPSGIHHYFFHLFALDDELDIPSDSDREALDLALNGHILATATLVGLYQRS